MKQAWLILMNYLAFQYIPYSLQTLDWCTSFSSFHMMKGLRSRLPKPCPSVWTTRCLELDTKQLAFFQVITAPGDEVQTHDKCLAKHYLIYSELDTAAHI